MDIKKLLIIIPIILLFCFGYFEQKNYEANNYDIVRFKFICNKSICEIRHLKHGDEIKYIDQINISEIESFYTQLEDVPKTNSRAEVIYAKRKDGTSFRLSPLYIRPSRYVELELLTPLNEALKNDDVCNLTYTTRLN